MFLLPAVCKKVMGLLLIEFAVVSDCTSTLGDPHNKESKIIGCPEQAAILCDNVTATASYVRRSFTCIFHNLSP
jgi:hypothetical protein